MADRNPIADSAHSVPRPGPDTEAQPGERDSAAGHRASDDRPGSETGRIGGGGADAHNPSPVRVTDEGSAKRPRKRTTKKY